MARNLLCDVLVLTMVIVVVNVSRPISQKPAVVTQSCFSSFAFCPAPAGHNDLVFTCPNIEHFRTTHYGQRRFTQKNRGKMRMGWNTTAFVNGKNHQWDRERSTCVCVTDASVGQV